MIVDGDGSDDDTMPKVLAREDPATMEGERVKRQELWDVLLGYCAVSG